MRVYWRCCPIPTLSRAALRVLLVSLLVTSVCFIVLYTIIETHTLWMRSHQVRSREDCVYCRSGMRNSVRIVLVCTNEIVFLLG